MDFVHLRDVLFKRLWSVDDLRVIATRRLNIALNRRKPYSATIFSSARCWDQEKLWADVYMPALHAQTLLLVHLRVDKMILNGNTWIVCCSICVQMVILHMTMRVIELSDQMSYDL
jgi:hypothetical protein